MSNKRVAIVCMAYGTDPTGCKPSPQMRSVTAEASMLAKTRPGAGFILQGGYRHQNGPTESDLMLELLGEVANNRPVFLERKSQNTIEGAQAIAEHAKVMGYQELEIVCQRFHAWRVSYTFSKVLAGTGITFRTHTVRTPFGGNSQKRLNSARSWWPWEMLARAYTIATLR